MMMNKNRNENVTPPKPKYADSQILERGVSQFNLIPIVFLVTFVVAVQFRQDGGRVSTSGGRS